ncbi:MAG: hypothetical protein ACRBK7_12340 [Acidimicrobiales bacterium]
MARLSIPDNTSTKGRALRLLLLLLAIDFVFLVLHAAHVRFDVPGSGLWLISRDRGFPELFQYAKEAAIIVLLLTLGRRWPSAVYAAWALAFTYLLLDDSVEIHETLGEALAERIALGTTLGIEARDLGQVLVSGAVGAVLLVLITAATLRDHTQARRLTFALAPIVVALAFFGVVTDVIDAIDFFGITEDGGEMVTMSAAVAVTFDHHLTRRTRNAEQTARQDTLAMRDIS